MNCGHINTKWAIKTKHLVWCVQAKAHEHLRDIVETEIPERGG